MILYHSGVSVLSGGFTGVDVFFVISGYLITTILLADLATGQFSILTFYERRARRILPALCAVLLACLPFAWAWMTPEQLTDFAQSLVAVSLFSSNVLFWLKTGYFEAAAEVNPLLHTWSLAVEEQFYILFPLILWGIYSHLRQMLVPILWVLVLLSFALCLWLAKSAPSANFYLAPTRAWELLAGALCAHALSHSGNRIWRTGPAAGALALSGLGMILASFVLIGPDTPFPSTWALMPVIGTVMVILFAAPLTICGRLLAFRPMVAIGLISYSAYLIHLPLLAFARLRYGVEPPLVICLGLAALSLPLAWICWRYVEQPFRGRAPALLKSRGSVLTVSMTVLAGWVGLGLIGAQSNGWAGRFPQIVTLNQTAAIPGDTLTCEFTGEFDKTAAWACLKSDAPTIVLLGDSHAYAIRTAFHATARAHGLTPVTFHQTGCFPVPHILRLPAAVDAHRTCRTFVDRAYDMLAETDIPVVLFTRWALNLDGTRFDNLEGGVEHGKLVQTAIVSPSGTQTAVGQVLANHVARELTGFAKVRTQPLILIGPFPEAGWNVPDMVASRLRLGQSAPTLSTASKRFQNRNAQANRLLNRLDQAGLAVVDVAKLFCDTKLPGRCVNYIDGVVYYSDDDHPSPAAARMIVDRIFAVQSLGKALYYSVSSSP